MKFCLAPSTLALRIRILRSSILSPAAICLRTSWLFQRSSNKKARNIQVRRDFSMAERWQAREAIGNYILRALSVTNLEIKFKRLQAPTSKTITRISKTEHQKRFNRCYSLNSSCCYDAFLLLQVVTTFNISPDLFDGMVTRPTT